MEKTDQIAGISVSAEELRQLRMGLLNVDHNINHINEPGRLDHTLNAYLGYLHNELLNASDEVNLDQAKDMLREIAFVVETGNVKAWGAEFGRFTDGLVAIYHKGFAQDGMSNYLETVDSYAGVIESISREFPLNNYDEALQSLLFCMSQLFRRQQKGWVKIYGRLAAMPELIGLVQQTKQKYFFDIAEWVEGGAQNLFEIRNDYASAERKLHLREQLVTQQIARIQRLYQQTDRVGNVIELRQGKRAGALSVLRRKNARIHNEILEKKRLIELIDLNIKEFQDLMAVARRSLFIRSVPKQTAINSLQTQNRSISPCSITGSASNMPSLIRSS